MSQENNDGFTLGCCGCLVLLGVPVALLGFLSYVFVGGEPLGAAVLCLFGVGLIVGGISFIKGYFGN